MRARFKETRDPSGMNECVLRASQDGAEKVQEALFSSPFLAERKLVVLEGYLSAPKATQEEMVDMVQRKPDSTVVVFYDEASASTLAKSPLFGLLKDEEFTEEYPALDGRSAEQFVVQECDTAGMKIETRAVRSMVTMVGTDTWTLHQESMKVCAYAQATGAKMITQQIVEEMVNGERDESMFAYLDACTQGRSGQATTLLESLFEQGVAELQLVSMLGKQVRTMLGAKDLMERGVADKQVVASSLGVHPFPAGKAMAAARRASLRGLADLHDDLLETEHLLKTGGTRPKISLDLFTAKAASLK